MGREEEAEVEADTAKAGGASCLDAEDVIEAVLLTRGRAEVGDFPL